MLSQPSASRAKHPLEAAQSWDLHRRRQKEQVIQNEEPDDDNFRRVLKKHGENKHQSNSHGDPAQHLSFGKDPNIQVSHKPRKHKILKAGGSTMHAIMIDAGSQGTRIHIYEFVDRLLRSRDEILAVANGEMLSIPTTNTRWTDKYKPGLDAFAGYQESDELEHHVEAYLGPLLGFAKQVLKDKQDDWHKFPIYVKATGGLRTLPTPDRVRLMNVVRKLFRDETFNPFGFAEERFRTISGEEEGAYGWVAVNFIKGTLVRETVGTGTVLNPELTYGMVEMGGASTQIGFFENNGDVMANLFKLQLGGARHWNIYTHSFLYFGVNGAWDRLNAALLWKDKTTTNPCLPANNEIVFESWIHMNNENHFLPRSSPESIPYSATMVNHQSDFERCSQLTFSLLRTSANEEWVEFSHDGDCSFAGVYQPPLPTKSQATNQFIATSNYADIFAFLKLGTRASISDLGKAAQSLCLYDWQALKTYNQNLTYPITDEHELAQYCFRSVFAFQMLRNGYGFADDLEITAVDVLSGQKLGWALGSILYEINTLPWEFHPNLKVKGSNMNSPAAAVIGAEGTLSRLKNHAHRRTMLAACIAMAAILVHIVVGIKRRIHSGYSTIGPANVPV